MAGTPQDTDLNTQPQGAGRVIARNTLYNALGRGWEAVLALVLTAYIVRTIGAGGWGVWSLVAVFTGYASLMDLGLASGFSKYIAQHAAARDTNALSAVVSTGLFFYAILGGIIVAVGWPLIDGLMALIIWLHPGADQVENAAHLGELRFLFRGALLLFAANNCITALMAVPTGLQRMEYSNALSVAASLLKAVCTVAFLEAGFGVPGLLYTNAVVLAGLTAGSAVIAYRLCPGLRIGPSRVTREAFGPLFQFGWRSQIAKFANLINFQTDRVVVAVLSRFSNLALVGVYSLAEVLAGKVRQVPSLLVSALVPAASDLDARDQQDRLRELYLRSTKYMAALAVPLALFSAVAAGALLRIIAGDAPHLEQAAWVARILILGYLANLLPAPGVSIVLGKGRADLQMYAGILSTVTNIGFTLLFVWAIGFMGIPLATALGMLISTTWFMRHMNQTLGVSLGRVLRECVAWPAAAALPGALFLAAALRWTPETAGIGGLLAALALGSAGAGIAYVAVLGGTRYLDAFDVAFLRDTLHLGRVPGFGLLTRGAQRV